MGIFQILKITPLMFVVLASLASCAGGSKYTGDEYYYKENGVNWSCREPKAFKGGNCKPEREWVG